MEYTAETEKELTFFFKAFVKGLISEFMFCEKISIILDYTFINSFKEYQSRRIISVYPPTKETIALMDAIGDYFRSNEIIENLPYKNPLYPIRKKHKDIREYVELLFIEWNFNYLPKYVLWCKSQPQQVALQTAPIQQPILPNELHTDRAVKSLAKAVEMGYLERTDTGYKTKSWNDTQLGYFIQQMINPNGYTTIPYKKLEMLFGVTRLDSIITRVDNVKQPQKWRKEIDKLFN